MAVHDLVLWFNLGVFQCSYNCSRTHTHTHILTQIMLGEADARLRPGFINIEHLGKLLARGIDLAPQEEAHM
jgi:hypothetical protein